MVGFFLILLFCDYLVKLLFSLAQLVQRSKEDLVEQVLDTLCKNLVNNSDQLQDISGVALKTVINELPLSDSHLSRFFSKKLANHLITACCSKEADQMNLEIIDILSELLGRYGDVLVPEHPHIVVALMPHLRSSRSAVRKRTIQALGQLVTVCQQPILVKLVSTILADLTCQQAKLSDVKTGIILLTMLCRRSGSRFGEFSDRVFATLYERRNSNDEDLKDECLQAYEALLRACPKEVSNHVEEIVEQCLANIAYDPNYAYDDEDDEMNGENGECDDEGDAYSEADDDDDMSWKVRRAAAKCLDAAVSTQPGMLVYFYEKVSPVIISRFREREEGVRMDVINVYGTLVRQSRPFVSQQQGSTIDNYLMNAIPSVVAGLMRHLQDRRVKTRPSALGLLTELTQTRRGCLAQHLPKLIPAVVNALGDKASPSGLRIEILTFIYHLLATHDAAVCHPFAGVLVGGLVPAANDQFYKIVSESLLCIQEVVRIIRDPSSEQVADDALVAQIYDVVIHRLLATDIDQEVKERAISCMGYLLAVAGDVLASKVSTVMPVFLDRLRNEVTRLSAVRAVSVIASSSLKPPLAPITDDAGIELLATFLRKNLRSLKLASIHLLDLLLANYMPSISQGSVTAMLTELVPLLADSDLQVTQMAVHLWYTASLVCKPAVVHLTEQLLQQLRLLVRSTLLQGPLLTATADLFRALVGVQSPQLSTGSLFRLITNEMANANKFAYRSMARCCAAVLLADPNTAESKQLMESIVQTISTPIANGQQAQNTSIDQVYFSLLVVGELGRATDVQLFQKATDAIVACFDAPTEDVKMAAAFALGSLAVGQLNTYLPVILNQLTHTTRRQYVVLHAVKELVSSPTAELANALRSHMSEILQVLSANAASEEEGTRGVVSECLGQLAPLAPEQVVPVFEQLLNSTSTQCRTTAISCIKFAAINQFRVLDDALTPVLLPALMNMNNPDIRVRHTALLTFNALVHNRLSLVRPHVPTLMPLVYEETNIRKDLIREVEMGPFKHTEDKGLELRKAAFECLYTVLRCCLDLLDLFEFVTHVARGLNDHYDIKLLSYMTVTAMTRLCPTVVIQKLDILVDPIQVSFCAI